LRLRTRIAEIWFIQGVSMASLFISRYQLKPEKRDEFVRALKAMYEGGREFITKETNFVFYGFGRDPNEFVAIESWKNEAVVNALRATEQFKQGFAVLMACASKPMEIELFRDWDDDASVFDQYPRGESRLHPKIGGLPTLFS
jgi:quinol monooxygenase YgiN